MGQSADTLTSFATVPPLQSGGEPPIRLVVVDDDVHYCELLSNELAEHGFSVTAFPDAQSMLSEIDSVATADLIVLNWHLPRTNGIELMRQLKRRGLTLPIVFLTGRSLISYESLALKHGAVDFIDKSRGIAILVHRLRLVIPTKSSEPRREALLQVGKLSLRPRSSRVSWNEVDVDLTLGEFRIVNLLVSKIGQHVSYREIYDCLHYRGFIAGSGENGYRCNVRSAIKRIRQKFEACDPEFDEIENYPSFGYIWSRN